MLNFGPKRPRHADEGGSVTGTEQRVTDLSGRSSMQLVSAVLASVEQLATARGAVSGSQTLLDEHGRSVIAAELERCLNRAMVENQPPPTPVTLSDVLDVAELAVRILVMLPLKNRLACKCVCRAWASRVRYDCEDEYLHDSKTIRCTLLHRMASPVIHLGLFSRSSSLFVLALSKSCALRKFLCNDLGVPTQSFEWEVPETHPEAMRQWQAFWAGPERAQGEQQAQEARAIAEAAAPGASSLASGLAAAGSGGLAAAGGSAGPPGCRAPGSGAGEPSGGLQRAGAPADAPAASAAALPPSGGGSSGRLREPGDAQVVVNNAGSYLMLLQHGEVRLFHALFHREWTPSQISLNFALPPRVTALQFFPLDNNVFAVAHAAVSEEAHNAGAAVHTIQVFTVRGAIIQTLRGFHQRPIESIWYFKDASFTFQVTHSADVVHWWRLSHNPQWPGMVHEQPTRSLQLAQQPDGGHALAVRLHPSGMAVMVASSTELRVHSYCDGIQNAKRTLRVITAATLLCLERDGVVLVAGSACSERSDQILFFSCAGLHLLKKCSLATGAGLFTRITVIERPEVPETRTMKKRPNSIHELAVGNEQGEVILLRYA